MNFPRPDDYIDIHNHGAVPAPGIFTLETIMAHEEREPENRNGIAYTFGIHPWYLDESNHDLYLSRVLAKGGDMNVAAIGEAGFDRIKGPSRLLQQKTFEEQVGIAEDQKKPVVIHCVRAWDDLLQVQRKLRPVMPWLVHGFRGKPGLAMQLISKGMYLSFWFDFVMRPESADLLRAVPIDRIFLETDGSEVDIKVIYNKVSADIGFTVDDLKKRLFDNYNQFFKKNNSHF